MALIYRAQNRQQAALIEGLPDRAFFASRGSKLLSSSMWSTPRPGIVTFDLDGIRFTPKKGPEDESRFAWSDVHDLRLAPARNKVGVGSLTISMDDGAKATFLVPRFGPMAELLSTGP